MQKCTERKLPAFGTTHAQSIEKCQKFLDYGKRTMTGELHRLFFRVAVALGIYRSNNLIDSFAALIAKIAVHQCRIISIKQRFGPGKPCREQLSAPLSTDPDHRKGALRPCRCKRIDDVVSNISLHTGEYTPATPTLATQQELWL
ncbi:hypothetical protein SDC9_183819 [bioreactor metagenome]|uniref:Uncharacterized protein n=1 Tax=bioreactor metagenome TaxID=1076179 RepID=A0A645HC62_9ZZZZ